jgi:hypothetical protein
MPPEPGGTRQISEIEGEFAAGLHKGGDFLYHPIQADYGK